MYIIFFEHQHTHTHNGIANNFSYGQTYIKSIVALWRSVCFPCFRCFYDVPYSKLWKVHYQFRLRFNSNDLSTKDRTSAEYKKKCEAPSNWCFVCRLTNAFFNKHGLMTVFEGRMRYGKTNLFRCYLETTQFIRIFVFHCDRLRQIRLS